MLGEGKEPQCKLEPLWDWAYIYSKEGAITVNTNYGTNSGKSEGVVWKKNCPREVLMGIRLSLGAIINRPGVARALYNHLR